jgi:U5 snRNP spliceosome subunit
MTIVLSPRDWHFPGKSLRVLWAFGVLISLAGISPAWGNPPPPPVSVEAVDHPGDKGNAIDVWIELPPPPETPPEFPTEYQVERAGERHGLYEVVASAAPTPDELKAGRFRIVVDKCHRGEPYWFRVRAVDPGPDGASSASVMQSNPDGVVPTRQAFDENRLWVLILLLTVCGAIVTFVVLAWLGMPLKVRRIAGLDAIEDAVGRATEMGRSCLYVPGIQDMNEMQTIAGLTILSRVAERAAEYDCRLETPTSKSLVMTAARETIQNAFLAAGRPEAYTPDDTYYVTDEQFAYVSYLTGKMVREKPAACFYLGSFYAESLILAETGNAVGAIQIAGTAQPAQLPFFVAACDYTLIGEEFFAASAYLSGAPDQLGSLKGQDVGKMIVAALVLVGVVLVTLHQVTDNEQIAYCTNYLMNVILHSAE